MFGDPDDPDAGFWVLGLGFRGRQKKQLNT